MLNIIDRREDARSTVETMNHRNIYSHGRDDPHRDVSRVTGIILHHTNFVSRRESRFDSIIANYVVMQDGTVLFVRDIGSALNSVGTDRHCIDIEFVGVYHRADGEPPPFAQIRAGRELIRHLVETHSITRLFAHAHFTAKPCPGPHLWYNVGAWACVRWKLSSDGASRRVPANWSNAELATPYSPTVAVPHTTLLPASPSPIPVPYPSVAR